jgi:hypothetical protein
MVIGCRLTMLRVALFKLKFCDPTLEIGKVQSNNPLHTDQIGFAASEMCSAAGERER